MGFIEFLAKLLAVLNDLLAAWPMLAVAALFIPALVNLIKFISSKIGLPIDGISAKIAFGLNAVAFVGYGVARWFDIDTSGIEPVFVALATLITALLAILGGLVSKVAYPLWKSHGGKVLGFSFNTPVNTPASG